VWWLKVLWENWRASVWRSLSPVVLCLSLSCLSPRQGGFVPLL
jgi:hypothetical protein